MNTPIDLGLLHIDEYVARRSVTLLNDPDATLDEAFELKRYVSKLDPEYAREIESLSSVSRQPLSNEARIIVTIVAYGEGTKIRKTLDSYLKQDLPHHQFEIIILDNHPEAKGRDNTVTEVQKFHDAHPSISVIYAYKIWTGDEIATVGNARKYVFDIAITRICKRDVYKQETVLVSNDADVFGIDDNYLSSILQEFDANKKVDALATSVVVPKNTIVKPNIYAVLSLWDYLDEVVAIGEPTNLRGLSSAYRTSIYCAIGGYNPKGKMAGDLETGTLIADARNWNPGCVISFKKTRIIQDPRRIIMAMANRTPVNEMYYDFVSKPEIRQADNDQLLALIPNDVDWELLEDDVDSFWQGRHTGMYKWRGAKFPHDFRYAMDKIGIAYEIVNDRVHIKNLDKLLLQYENDFGKKIQIIHSEKHAWNQQRQDEMKSFFSGISEGISASRKKMSTNIITEMNLLGKNGNSNSINTLRQEYQRFSEE